MLGVGVTVLPVRSTQSDGRERDVLFNQHGPSVYQVCARGRGLRGAKQTQTLGPTEPTGNYYATLLGVVRVRYSVWRGTLTALVWENQSSCRSEDSSVLNPRTSPCTD